MVVRVSNKGASCWIGIGDDFVGPLPAGTILLPRGSTFVVPGSLATVLSGLYLSTWTFAGTGKKALETFLTRYVDAVPQINQRRWVLNFPGTFQLQFNIWAEEHKTFDYELVLATDLGADDRIQVSVNAGRLGPIAWQG